MTITWEYLIVDTPTWSYPQVHRLTQALNEYGAQGWEIVHMVLGDNRLATRVVFKRQVLDKLPTTEDEQE